jgi:hypothetical protein
MTSFQYIQLFAKIPESRRASTQGYQRRANNAAARVQDSILSRADRSSGGLVHIAARQSGTFPPITLGTTALEPDAQGQVNEASCMCM